MKYNPSSAFNVPCRPGPMKIRHRVAGIIARGDGLLVTGYELNGGRFYSLPGGEQRPGETAERALARELAEETGCSSEVGPLAYVAETFFADPYDARPMHLVGLYFHAEIEGEPKLGFASPEAPEARIMTEVRFRDRRTLPDIALYPVGLGDTLIADWGRDAPGRYLRLPATENTLWDCVTGTLPRPEGGIRSRGVGVVVEDGKVLATFYGRDWSLPGGAVEPDELIPEAVARELAEETGLIVEPQRLLFVNDNFFTDPVRAPEMQSTGLHELGFYWLCRVVGGEFDPGPHIERSGEFEESIRHYWRTLEELRGLPLYPKWLAAEIECGVREGWPTGARHLVSGDALAR
ncbi:MAG TPA: NUDIX domain-containing protein [bacterium]|nr:NUDIX domain-containing protein [bacterium]